MNLVAIGRVKTASRAVKRLSGEIKEETGTSRVFR